MESALIDEEGNANLDFVHASSYTIVVSEAPIELEETVVAVEPEEDTIQAEETINNANEGTNTWVILLIVIAVVIVACGGYVIYKKKKA